MSKNSMKNQKDAENKNRKLSDGTTNTTDESQKSWCEISNTHKREVSREGAVVR